ncbi:calcium-binding protein [Streptomyces sp. Lzd4kr]|nr:calcium-binding protein [Streptomyces sp. Lzd4kr]
MQTRRISPPRRLAARAAMVAALAATPLTVIGATAHAGIQGSDLAAGTVEVSLEPRHTAPDSPGVVVPSRVTVAGDDADNAIDIRQTGDKVVVTAGSGTNVVNPDGRCSPIGNQVVCLVDSDGSYDVEMGRGDDSVLVSTLTGSVIHADLGQGDDHIDLTDSAINSTLEGGLNHDILKGGSGDDVFIATAGGDGPDVMRGGFGVDTVSYAVYTVPVTVDLTGQRPSGAAGENDQVLEIENATGGSKNDLLIGAHGPMNDPATHVQGTSNVLRGGAGNDTMQGGDPGDTVIGADPNVDGSDTFFGGSGLDTVTYAYRTTSVIVDLDNVADDGSPGEGDDVRGDVENLVGGSGDDDLKGRRGVLNRLSGGPGVDEIRARDGDRLDILDGGTQPTGLMDFCYIDLGDRVLSSCEAVKFPRV